MKGNRSTHRSQAARQVGRAGRRHRHGDGSAPSETARHVRFAAFRSCCGPVDPWHPSDPRSTHIRLSNASAPVTQIVEGVRRLGSAFDALRLGPPAFRNVSTVIEDVC